MANDSDCERRSTELADSEKVENKPRGRQTPDSPGHSTTEETMRSTLKNGEYLKRITGIGGWGTEVEEDGIGAGCVGRRGGAYGS